MPTLTAPPNYIICCRSRLAWLAGRCAVHPSLASRPSISGTMSVTSVAQRLGQQAVSSKQAAAVASQLRDALKVASLAHPPMISSRLARHGSFPRIAFLRSPVSVAAFVLYQYVLPALPRDASRLSERHAPVPTDLSLRSDVVSTEATAARLPHSPTRQLPVQSAFDSCTLHAPRSSSRNLSIAHRSLGRHRRIVLY